MYPINVIQMINLRSNDKKFNDIRKKTNNLWVFRNVKYLILLPIFIVECKLKRETTECGKINPNLNPE